MMYYGILFVIAAYLLGSVPFGLIVGELFHKDIRNLGSGNIGATNTYRTLGPAAGLIVFVLDFLKGVLPVFVFTFLFKKNEIFEIFLFSVAFATLLGHTFSVFLKFKGGKGVATAAGVLIVLSWKVTLVLVFIWGFFLISWGMVSAASIFAAFSLPVMTFYFERGNAAFLIFSFLTATLIIYKHRSNIKRIKEGKEPRVVRI